MKGLSKRLRQRVVSTRSSPDHARPRLRGALARDLDTGSSRRTCVRTSEQFALVVSDAARVGIAAPGQPSGGDHPTIGVTTSVSASDTEDGTVLLRVAPHTSPRDDRLLT